MIAMYNIEHKFDSKEYLAPSSYVLRILYNNAARCGSDFLIACTVFEQNSFD